jgi:NADH:ubiquinone oxidoreductase subunit 6 (subunit J)
MFNPDAKQKGAVMIALLLFAVGIQLIGAQNYTNSTCTVNGVSVPCSQLASGFESLGIAILAIYLIVAIVAFVLFIWMVIDCAKYQEKDKVVWILIILLIAIIGPIIYYFVAKRPRDRLKKAGKNQQPEQPYQLPQQPYTPPPQQPT